MKIEDRERLFRLNDSSDEAVARRLRAARLLVTPSQKQFAALTGQTYTTYNSQEVKGRPGRETFEYLYRNARVGPNFILFGDFLPLPYDVLNSLEAALHEIDLSSDRRLSEG